ncbi:hypothetical protein QFC21_006244 [Naganishia friedmannii]|uniref:Uncharacterized protein n=1 Tax=Naganishia friedmannii TaxID=89922 RepID=A0ACC2V4U7_9TREE|nr:hypothetical protein QFC21_006244 [Naganishia friedmannii]
MLYLFETIIFVLAIRGSDKAMPTGVPMGHQSQASARALDDGVGSACVSATCDATTCPGNAPQFQELARRSDLSNGDPPASTSDIVTVTATTVTTSTTTELATVTELSTVTATGTPSPPQARLEMFEEYTFDNPEILWAGGPRPDVFVHVPEHSWEEFAAVCNLIIQHESTHYTYAKWARARTNQDGDIWIPLNLFPGSSEPLVLDVMINKTEHQDLTKAQAGLWVQPYLADSEPATLSVRALAKAFDHDSVKDRLFKSNALYDISMYTEEPYKNPRKTMALLEMLTGYPVETMSKAIFRDAEALMDDLESSTQEESGGEAKRGVDANPTIVCDTNLTMRPLIRERYPNPQGKLLPYRLLDRHVGGTFPTAPWQGQYNRTAHNDPSLLWNSNTPESYDRSRDIDQLYGNMTWIIRLAERKALDVADATKKLKSARTTFDFYHYENGIPQQAFASGGNTDRKRGLRERLKRGDEEPTVTVTVVETSTQVESSTITTHATTTLLVAPPASPLEFPIADGYTLDDRIILWLGGPTLDDYAEVPKANQTDGFWARDVCRSDKLIVNVQVSKSELREYSQAHWTDHKDVQERLTYVKGEMSAEPLLAPLLKNTVGILQMLTGYPVEIKSVKEYADAVTLAKDLTDVDAIPTIILDSDGGIRPIITNGTDRYRLLDSRMGGTLNRHGTGGDLRNDDAHHYYRGNTAEAYDRTRTIEEVRTSMAWIIRLAQKQSLNFADATEKLAPAKAAFDSYYYEKRDS